MKKLTINASEKFNYLTVIKMLGVNDKGFSTAECRCECGNSVVVKIAELRSGHKKSCGCKSSKEKSKKASADLVGKKFSRLLVESYAGSDNRKYKLVNCLCDCGQRVKIRIARLLCGESQSCGCLQREKAMENLATAQKRSTVHGLSGTLTGRSWLCMMQRCFNPRSESFHRYGAVGIKPCRFIKESPIHLVLLIGERPHAGMQLDRIKNELGYYCGACEECLEGGNPINIRWATPSEQALNRTNNRLVEIDGVIKKGSEWCRLLGLSKTSKKIYSYPKKDSGDD